ncbi:uncharacterized protein LOC114858698 [Betta splendens]|uniref:Uncharacterized protein LOC114858698 n=1 Tax=Betta splendens TaxID=158456 RepID=A0A8M1HG71_BETSP|nr:uncharacterized protein LOC114858698 [Betta splendens]
MAKDFTGSCLFNVLGAGFTILIIAAFPVTEITIGALYLHECPVAPAIPVCVMVWGILVLMVIGLLLLPKLCPGAPDNTTLALSIWSLFLLLVIAVLYGSYHIYAVYPPNYNKALTHTNGPNSSIPRVPAADKVLPTAQNENHTLPLLNHTWTMHKNHTLTDMIQKLVRSRSEGEHLNATAPYCNRTVYLFAFWTTTLAYVLTGLSLVILFFFYFCMKLLVSIVYH